MYFKLKEKYKGYNYMESSAPKKRGRKPKNKTITNKGADFKVNPKNDNLIVTIPVHKQVKSQFKDMSGYEVSDNFCECEPIESTCCWNCTYEIAHHISAPISYRDGVFYTYGSFCCFGCVSRYLVDTYQNRELWDKYSLLNLYYNRVKGTQDKVVPIYPSRLRLTKFGGDIDIKDYRHINHGTFPNDIMLDPIFPVNHSIYEYEAKTKGGEKYDYNLQRNTPLKKNKSILGKMNIS